MKSNFLKLPLEERIKIYLQLNSKKGRGHYGLFYFEGRISLNYAICGNFPLVEVLTTEDDIETLPKDIRVSKIARETLAKISPVKINEGIITICRMVKYDVKKMVNGDNILILDGVKDPSNLAGIYRSGNIFGFSHIIGINNCIDLFNPRAVRASMGGFFNFNLSETDRIDTLFSMLKKKNYTIYSSIPKGGTPLEKIDIRKPFAIIGGNEPRGISQEVLRNSDELITINQMGRCESLNLTSAMTILMFWFSLHHQQR